MENLESEIKNLSLGDGEENSNKIQFEFKTYKIIPNSLHKDITLPTPESLEKFIEPQKNLIKYDILKHKTLIKETEEGPLLDLSSIPNIEEGFIFKKILFFLGCITSDFDHNEFYENDTVCPIDYESIENCNNYVEYLTKNIDLFTYMIKIETIKALFSALKDVGIDIFDEKNILYSLFKDNLFCEEENKILILITPSNNFWIKSQRMSINDDINYDLKLNNFTKIFFNHSFIEKFLKKVASHKRCVFGLLSSMTMKNLKQTKDVLFTQYNGFLPGDECFLFDQKCHDNINEGTNQKPKFYRNLDKIIQQVKNFKPKTKKENDENENKEEKKGPPKDIKENRIIILESEKDKVCDSTKGNTIFLSVFSEQYLEFSANKKAEIDLKGDKIIEYLVNLLDNCSIDVREYIAKNPIKFGE